MYLLIAGFKITEPATLVTDYVMGLLACVFALKLCRSHKGWWAAAFLALALSSFLGGTFHGFKLVLSPPFAMELWRATILTAFLCAASLLLAIAGQLQPISKKFLIPLAIIKLTIFATLGWTNPTFLLVLCDFAITFAILLAHAIPQFPTNPAYSKNMSPGIALFIVGGAIQYFRLAPHPWFNHNDLFHLIQIVANIFLFCAAQNQFPPSTSSLMVPEVQTNLYD